MRGGPVIVLVVLTLALPAASQVADDKLIVPGQRIGRWTLDMTIEDLLKMNGPRKGDPAGAPTGLQRRPGRDAAADIWEHQWSHLGIYAGTSGRDGQQVIYLSTEWDFKSAKGIGIDVARDAMEAAYGRPTAVTVTLPADVRPEILTAIYDEIGLAAWIVSDRNLIAASIVFRPGTARSIWKY
jgi:hypothetical protein